MQALFDLPNGFGLDLRPLGRIVVQIAHCVRIEHGPQSDPGPPQVGGGKGWWHGFHYGTQIGKDLQTSLTQRQDTRLCRISAAPIAKPGDALAAHIHRQ